LQNEFNIKELLLKMAEQKIEKLEVIKELQSVQCG
jgi:hypothetical protein